jgi:hypothetical protein
LTSCGPPATSAVMDDPARLASIRRAMQRGTLPSERVTQIFAGPAAGLTCDACGEIIPRTTTEYEFDFRGRAVRLHLRCFAAWANEVDRISRAE